MSIARFKKYLNNLRLCIGIFDLNPDRLSSLSYYISLYLTLPNMLRADIGNSSSTPIGMMDRRAKCENMKSNHRRPLSDISSTHKDITIGNGNSVSDRHQTIIVEGNIGSGKSTLLKYFGQKDNIEIFPEPVDKWRNIRGQNMLDLFYQDPVRWSFAFESYTQFTRLEIHQAKTKQKFKMMERSIYSGKYCFTENLYQSKKLKTPEYNVLCQWFDWLLTTKDLHVDHIVYLRSTPEQCERRICERSRKEESGIPMEYLRELHETHEDWLIKKTKFELPAPVIVLDATKPLNEMHNQFKLLEEKLNLNIC
ncbi:thymidine kinase 2, mitochondrial-like [Asterias rubens]|uniref:thymidine kinase 2, mitochondrial-like n=1 Tax=Asterias rubens TaxID=7604 RepID=UPI001455C7C8|nr:thymidine kinase 2, mitochondrial-like [Asterias rubens]